LLTAAAGAFNKRFAPGEPVRICIVSSAAAAAAAGGARAIGSAAPSNFRQ